MFFKNFYININTNGKTYDELRHSYKCENIVNDDMLILQGIVVGSFLLYLKFMYTLRRKGKKENRVTFVCTGLVFCVTRNLRKSSKT